MSLLAPLAQAALGLTRWNTTGTDAAVRADAGFTTERGETFPDGVKHLELARGSALGLPAWRRAPAPATTARPRRRGPSRRRARR